MQTFEWETTGYPVVFATHQSKIEGAPTLLFYGHYDVQPPDPLDEWKSDPFKPEEREKKIYARGAIDNKGQGFYTILAIQAFIELFKNHNINIKLLIEGEEEIGSPGLEAIAKTKEKELQADHIFIVDLDMYDAQTPALTLGIRGITNLNVDIRNANTDLHSGSFGGVVLNPAKALSTVLSKIWNDEGKIVIPNFYDGIKNISKNKFSDLDWEKNLQVLTDIFDAKAFESEKGFSLLESNWVRPTIEINGMMSGYSGKGSKTIIPSRAMVKLSCRLVEGQDPLKVIKAIKAFLINNLPKGIEVEFETGHGTPGFMTSFQSKTVQVTTDAYFKVFNQKCKKVLCGATIPIVPLLSKICGGELVMMGVALPTDGMHAPNESIEIDRFEKGFLSIAYILDVFQLEAKNEQANT